MRVWPGRVRRGELPNKRPGLGRSGIPFAVLVGSRLGFRRSFRDHLSSDVASDSSNDGGFRGPLDGEDDTGGWFDPIARVVEASVGADGANDGVRGRSGARGAFENVLEDGANVAPALVEEAEGVSVRVNRAIVRQLIISGDVPNLAPVEKFLLDGRAIRMMANGAFARMALETFVLSCCFLRDHLLFPQFLLNFDRHLSRGTFLSPRPTLTHPSRCANGTRVMELRVESLELRAGLGCVGRGTGVSQLAGGSGRAISLLMPTKGSKGKWVVYERRLVGPNYAAEIVYVSRFFPTRLQAEKAREKLKGQPEHEKASLGVGFVRRKGGRG
jgi:hypothetical protein